MAAAADSLPSEPVRAAIQRGLQTVVLKVQRTRFSAKGPFPVSERKLGIRTGRLRRDLHSETVTIQARGYRGRVGSVVEYFGAHEQGFSGTVNVRAHSRRAYNRGGKRGYTVLPQSVRAHTKQVNIPKREPLAAGLREHAEPILRAEVSRGIASMLKA